MPKVKLPRKLRDLAKTAKSGCGEAAYAIAEHYLNGTGGVEKNDELARQWLEKGAELGNADAQRFLGFGYNTEGDHDAALKWYERAAAQGHTSAMYSLGFLYKEGEGVEQNITTAAEWWRRAACKGHAPSQCNYGAYLADVTLEYEAAMTWYEKAAAQGVANAMCNIGDMYYLGKGVRPDSSKAREWWEKAAALGHEVAKNTLTRHTTEDLEHSLNRTAVLDDTNFVLQEKWLRNAVAERGDKKDVDLWTRRDVTLSYVHAAKKKALLDAMELSGLQMTDEAVERYVSGPLPDHDACGKFDNLARCFLHGRCGLEKNLRLAKEMFKVAEIYYPDNAAVAEELVKLRACVTCGRTDARWGCKLCRGVRYCDKRCQQRDWNRGDPPHKETCARVVHMFPPGFFGALREKVAKEEEASA
jgi:TPR repeat protein